jgi:hypothetical protein
MAKTTPLQNQWYQGMKRDVSRTQMPASSLWNAVDVIANYGAPLRQRGGWSNYSSDISAVTAGAATSIRAGVWTVFATSGGGSSEKNLAIDEDGHLYNVGDGTATSIGAALVASQNPVFHGGTAVSAATAVYTGLVIIPDGTGAAGPKKYDGTTLSNLNGSPPAARYATVSKDYTVLGNGSVGGTYYPDRIWFSPEGDPDCAVSSVTAWDTTDSWIGLSRHVTGLGSTRNALLVFHDNAVTRIRGSIPPPDEDMIVDDGYFDVGLIDPFTIAPHRDHILWASPEGVFRSDGAILDDLTRRGGMLRYWLDMTVDATSAWSFAGGTIRDTYFLSVMNGDTFVDCFAIDLLTLSWTRLSNVDAMAIWSGQLNAADELYWGRRGAARVARMSTIYEVGNSTYKNDGDGDAVLPEVETPFYPLGHPGPKRVRRIFVGHEVTDYATDQPTATVSYITTPEETSYTSAGTFAENLKLERKTLTIGKQALGLGVKFSRTNAGDFLLYDIEAEVTPYEQSRRIA